VAGARLSVVMLLENHPYPEDVRVRSEAESLARQGYRVKVIAPRRPGQAPRERVGEVQVSRYRLPPERAGALGLLGEYFVANLQLHVRGLLELVRGVDVIHLHNPPDTLFAVAWAARLRGARVIFDHHDLSPELCEVKFGERHRLLLALLRLLERLTLRSASHVLAANESHREVALQRGGRSSETVTVVRNGPPSRILGEPSLGRPGALAEPALVFVGSMATQDGVLELAELLLELEHRHGLRARLTIVGDGPARAQLADRIRRLGLAERVCFTGQVPAAEVFEHLRQADICLDPAPCNALNHRSTMVKVAEYLAAGKPVVAYRLRETERTTAGAALLAVCGDQSAFVDAIARLAGDQDLRRHISGLAVQRARELTWEHSERALLDAYARL
jgi:glycosyltransferase involved in cell wall biosynthesis